MTPDDRFAECAAFTLHQEDQTDSGVFENDPRDPGGATRWGVTQATLSTWFGRPASVDEVRNLPRDTALAIARHNYWTPTRCDDLPAGVDLMVFDMAYNAGCGTAARILQTVVGVPSDGAIGPATLKAVTGRDADTLIGALAEAQLAHYRALLGWATFGNGWGRRVADRRDTARLMAHR